MREIAYKVFLKKTYPFKNSGCPRLFLELDIKITPAPQFFFC